MEIFEVLSDPVRRRIVELLAVRPRTAGELGREFDISRPAVSRHLRVLREGRVVRYRPDAQRRIYSLDPAGLDEADAWLERCRKFWNARLDDFERELEREPRGRKSHGRARKNRRSR